MHHASYFTHLLDLSSWNKIAPPHLHINLVQNKRQLHALHFEPVVSGLCASWQVYSCEDSSMYD